jgi:hypothetical protein
MTGFLSSVVRRTSCNVTALVEDAKQVVIAAKKRSASILLALAGILPDNFVPHTLATVIERRQQHASGSEQNAHAPLANTHCSFIVESFFAAA